MSSLGFTSKEQRNLGLLVHLMTSNPKILYAPVGTEVDKVILKVRASAHEGAESRTPLLPLPQEGSGAGAEQGGGSQLPASTCRAVGWYLHGC